MTPDFGSPQKDETGRFWVAFAWREIHAPGALPHPATGRRRLGRGVAVSPPGRRGAWTAGSLAGFRQSAWGSFRPHTSARAMRQLPRTLPLGLCAVRNIPSVHCCSTQRCDSPKIRAASIVPMSSDMAMGLPARTITEPSACLTGTAGMKNDGK